MNPDMDFTSKCETLDAELRALGRVAVAFSGGVDSSVLLHAAVRVLEERAFAVIADSPSLPRRELLEARQLASRMGTELVVVDTRELDDPRYRANEGQRCYFCKHALFDAMALVARERGVLHMAFGKIRDDALDDRPGERAALEFGVVAPLDRARFDKRDVRRYAREYGLSVAEKPASACLASRIPVGTGVTAELLATVEAAEEDLRQLGVSELRVRHHGRKARVELGPADFERFSAERGRLLVALATHGFEEVEIARYRAPGATAARADGPGPG